MMGMRPRALWSRWLVCLLLVGAALPLRGQTTNGDFSVIVLPDPQNYSQYYPQIFKQQTQWIVDHRAQYNIQFVIGVGDMVNNPGSTTEWQNANAAIAILDNAKLPYAMAIGNHDYDGVIPSARGTNAFNHWFGTARYATSPWFKGSLNNSTENFYGTLTVGGTEYLILALEYYP